MTEIEYNNPLFSAETKLQIAIGAIDFRDKTIKNLRQQIKNLRTELSALIEVNCDKNIDKINEIIDKAQFSHLR